MRAEQEKRTAFIYGLAGLETDVRILKLTEDVSLGRLAASERDRLRPSPSFGPTLPLIPLEEFGVRVVSWLQSYEEARKHAWTQYMLVITALRLLKPGGVGVGLNGVAYGTGRGGWRRELPLMLSLSRTGYVSWRGGTEKLILTRGDGGRLRRLYSALSKMGDTSALAFRRFDMAYARDSWEDCLIDLWVALESLFAKEGETQELTYKFAMRIVHFVGQGPEQRAALFEQMKRAYNFRSKVVHGTGSPVDVRESVRHSQDALRRSLARVALEGYPPDPDQLDRQAAQGC